MYHLLKGLYRYVTSKEVARDKEYSVLLLGLDNAGKTTLLNQIKARYGACAGDGSTRPSAGDTVPTVGQNVSTIARPDLYLKIWDVGGQHALRRLWQSYYRSCHAIVFVIDSTDVGDGDVAKAAAGSGSGSGSGTAMAGRLDECRLVLEHVLHDAEAEGVPLLVLANKQDREDCLEVVRIKEGLVRKVVESDRATAVRDSRVLPVSALTGLGVPEAVDWLCSRVKWNKEARPPVMR
ncbi:MAG: ADP-ribosylation factor protein 3 [Phylliscum demangeonii]|nr:MAG: ADP-ribosylation factor protein 3 [Phylliscum demangeonii]